MVTFPFQTLAVHWEMSSHFRLKIKVFIESIQVEVISLKIGPFWAGLVLAICVHFIIVLGLFWCPPSFLSAAGLRSRSVHNKGEIVGEVKAYVWPEVESGKVRPVVHNVLPLKDAAKGHALMEESTHIGKIVLQVSS